MEYKYKIQVKTIKGIFVVEITASKILSESEAKEIGIRELRKENSELELIDFRYNLIRGC
jgi:hypothetical protein